MKTMMEPGIWSTILRLPRLQLTPGRLVSAPCTDHPTTRAAIIIATQDTILVPRVVIVHIVRLVRLRLLVLQILHFHVVYNVMQEPLRAHTVVLLAPPAQLE